MAGSGGGLERPEVWSSPSEQRRVGEGSVKLIVELQNRPDTVHGFWELLPGRVMMALETSGMQGGLRSQRSALTILAENCHQAFGSGWSLDACQPAPWRTSPEGPCAQHAGVVSSHKGSSRPVLPVGTEAWCRTRAQVYKASAPLGSRRNPRE